MDELLDDLKKLSARIEDIDRTISREREIIGELEKRRFSGGGDPAVREELERNRRRLRDLEYEEQGIRERKTDLESAYNEERIGRLNDELAALTVRRDAITDNLIPLLEDKIARLREEVEELDRSIMRTNGKIKFISEQ